LASKDQNRPASAWVLIVLLAVAVFLVWSGCDQDDQESDPNRSSGVKVAVIDVGQGDFSCHDLETPKGDHVPFRRLNCADVGLTTGFECNEYGLEIIESYLDLAESGIGNFNIGDCNLDFNKEMILAVCARRPCAETLALCDARKIENSVYKYRYLQSETCEDGSRETLNNFMVLPRTDLVIMVEIYHYLDLGSE
jgi:hypothetical protein